MITRLLRYFLGFCFFALAIFLAGSLLTHFPLDPCGNVYSDQKVHNFFGNLGAFWSDGCWQFYGTGSVFLPILSALHGTSLCLASRPKRVFFIFLGSLILPPLIFFAGGKAGILPRSWHGGVGYLWLPNLPFLGYLGLFLGSGIGWAVATLFLVGQGTWTGFREVCLKISQGALFLLWKTISWGRRFFRWLTRRIPSLESQDSASPPLEARETTPSLGEEDILEDEPPGSFSETFKQLKKNKVATRYDLPPLSLIQSPGKASKAPTQGELQKTAQELKVVLDDFSIKGTIEDMAPGPVVTLFQLKPSPGLKSSRVIALTNDIARSMKAVSARIAVIPGENLLGIELPNPERETVYLKQILSSDLYGSFPGALSLILGKDIGGNPMIADLATMPHLLVAGTTGSGKSVGVNGMILSLIFRLPPEHCRFLMIDPKMLELSVYDGIPHLLSPVITDPKKAVKALKWVLKEMESRYRMMSLWGVRNIDGYNGKILKDAEIPPKVKLEMSITNDHTPPTTLPYIVVVVDELSDLMLVAGKEVEVMLQRLAQMARAAGIHLILATQRPSVDVITGTIKANFPTRISFQVTSKIDSRTILEEQGAEQLLGKGDMLYRSPGGQIRRIHGVFTSDEDVEKVVHYLKKKYGPQSMVDFDTLESESDLLVSEGGGDDLLPQAIQVLQTSGKSSVSYLQRSLQIGYNRAARLMETLEKEGWVSPPNGVGKRTILKKN